MGTIFVENFMQMILGDLTFFSKIHISRENLEKARKSNSMAGSERTEDKSQASGLDCIYQG